MRVRRTRSSASPSHSPLTRSPLDVGSSMVTKVAVFALLIMGVSPSSPVVWTKPGEIRVVVVDRDRLPIPGVTVELSATVPGSAPRTMISDPKGRAGFDGVSAGDYMLTFQLSGFAPCSIGPITMRADKAGSPELPEFLVMMNQIRWS